MSSTHHTSESNPHTQPTGQFRPRNPLHSRLCGHRRPHKGWAFSRTGLGGGANRWDSIWERIASLSQRLQQVAIDCIDFRDCIKNWDTELTLFFLDPPYSSSISKGFYGNDLTWQDHKDLARVLAKTRGKWMLIYDDIPKLRELYRDFEISRISSKLASQKVPKGASRVDLHQILIVNYPLAVKNREGRERGGMREIMP